MPTEACMTTRRQFTALALALLSPIARARADAGSPALRSLQVVVPTPPGTQPDLLARWLVEPMARSAGIPGVVQNRPGAAGAIAADAVLAAAPETGPLLLGGLDHVAYSHVNNNRRPLDPLADFVPVGAVNHDTWLVVAPRESGASSLPELIAASKRAPLNYASGGEGTTAHLLAARLCRDLGIDATHVAYKDSYLPDLVAGRVQFALAPTPAMIGHVKGGRVRALASLTDERLAVLEGVPSIRELGWPQQVFYGGLFLFAPASLAPRAPQLNEWLLAAMAQPEIAARYRDAGIEPSPMALEQVRASVLERLRAVDAMRMSVFGRAR